MDLAAQDEHGDVSVRGVILQVATGLEVEQHDRDPAAAEERDLTVAVPGPTWLVAQALAFRRQVEQVLASFKAFAWWCSLRLLRRIRPLLVLGVHATSVTHQSAATAH